MALDRRTLRELLARPLIDERVRRATLVFIVSGDHARPTLHQISVSVRGAQRRAQDHVVIEVGAQALVVARLPGLATEVHVVAVAVDEADHPVTEQLATRAQGVLAASSTPRSLRSLPSVRVDDDSVAAFRELLERVLERVQRQHGQASPPPHRTPLDDADEPPPSVGTRRCDVSVLAARGITAQELLTALDAVMVRSRHRRCAHAGGGRDFILIRGHAGAGVRVVDDRAGSAMDLAVPLANALGIPVLVATATGEQELDPMSADTRTEIGWLLESVSDSGTSMAYRDATTLREQRPRLPLDERVVHHITVEVCAIEPEADGLAIHYERT